MISRYDTALVERHKMIRLKAGCIGLKKKSWDGEGSQQVRHILLKSGDHRSDRSQDAQKTQLGAVISCNPSIQKAGMGFREQIH